MAAVPLTPAPAHPEIGLIHHRDHRLSAAARACRRTLVELAAGRHGTLATQLLQRQLGHLLRRRRVLAGDQSAVGYRVPGWSRQAPRSQHHHRQKAPATARHPCAAQGRECAAKRAGSATN